MQRFKFEVRPAGEYQALKLLRRDLGVPAILVIRRGIELALAEYGASLNGGQAQ